MSSLPHRRFDFGDVFDGDGGVTPSRAPYRRSYTHEDVERLCEQARAEGEAAAMRRIEAAQAQALAQIAEAVRASLSTLSAAAHEHRIGAATLALVAARRIADAALELFPEAPARAALDALAREVEAAPRIVVRASPNLVERLQEVLAFTADQIGFTGRIDVRGEPGTPDAAFSFDWGDGKASFDPEAAAVRVSDALDAALASEGLHGEPINLTFDFHGS